MSVTDRLTAELIAAKTEMNDAWTQYTLASKASDRNRWLSRYSAVMQRVANLEIALGRFYGTSL